MGTAKVPDEVNDSIPDGTSDIENALELVLEAASTALNTKFEVVNDDLSADNVPVILNFDTPFSLTVAEDNPAGKEPDCNSKETFPAESGSSSNNIYC